MDVTATSTGTGTTGVGPPDADTPAIVEQVKTTIRRCIGRLDTEPSAGGGHWIITGDLIGRLVWHDDGKPYGVVVDGRSLSWEEFGRALEPFEGWKFRLSVADAPDEDDCRDQSAAGSVREVFGPTPRTRVH